MCIVAATPRFVPSKTSLRSCMFRRRTAASQTFYFGGWTWAAKTLVSPLAGGDSWLYLAPVHFLAPVHARSALAGDSYSDDNPIPHASTAARLTTFA